MDHGDYWREGGLKRGGGIIKLFAMDHVGLLEGEGGGGIKRGWGLIRGNSVLQFGAGFFKTSQADVYMVIPSVFEYHVKKRSISRKIYCYENILFRNPLAR